MTNTIIVLQGKSGIGKSTTIRLAFDLFIKNSDVSIVNFSQIRKTKDFTAIVDINLNKKSIRVGFSSIGDIETEIYDSIDMLKNAGCRIIVSACRTKGGPQMAIASFKKNFQIEFHIKENTAVLEDRTLRNNAMAAKLNWRIRELA